MAFQGRATAIAVLSALITPNTQNPDTLDLETSPINQLLCQDERFANEPSLSYACSGFLIAPDLLVTAGHCMANTGEVRNETQMYCEAYSWLFDYQPDGSGRVQTQGIKKSRHYKCKQIIFAVKDENFPLRDFALVQLDRPVTDREPVRLSSVTPQVGDSISMIGYPLGLPMKLSRNAKVVHSDADRQTILTNLDAFEGNSGSAVFNSSKEVIGILVGGTPITSFVNDTVQHCKRYNRCDDNRRNCLVPEEFSATYPGFLGIGSEVQRITPIFELLQSKSIKK
ncbi:MAG: trypsin-like serine peptidase [Bdellovibrio sp.]